VKTPDEKTFWDYWGELAVVWQAITADQPPECGESTGAVAPRPHVRHAFVRLRARWLTSVPRKQFVFSELDWRRIKAGPARIGIDADVGTIAPAAGVPELPLREYLQELAADHLGLAELGKPGEALTPRQEAAEIRKALKQARGLAATLDNTWTFSFSPHTEDVSKALALLIGHAQRFHDRLMAEGSQSGANARAVHIMFLDQLVQVWQTITAGRAPQRRRGRNLNPFLLACSGPVFPDKISQSTINDFLRKTGKRA
jgi:hypothetical protein